ncbi:hypothetical protein XENTR_v10018325 [Xenopus tropicalis]|nr:hypothetical protein XENTR_v10018325 [Xenopus tropicalis]
MCLCCMFPHLVKFTRGRFHIKNLTASRLCYLQLLYYAKKAILLQWKSLAPPTFPFWRTLGNNTLTNQKLTYLARSCPKKFDAIWGPWMTFFTFMLNEKCINKNLKKKKIPDSHIWLTVCTRHLTAVIKKFRSK